MPAPKSMYARKVIICDKCFFPLRRLCATSEALSSLERKKFSKYNQILDKIGNINDGRRKLVFYFLFSICFLFVSFKKRKYMK